MRFSIKTVAVATTCIALWITLIQNIPILGDLPALAFPLCIVLAKQPAESKCHRAFAFASAATLAFGLASWTSHWLRADTPPHTTPSQFIAYYFPFFSFSLLVGSVNLLSPIRGCFLDSPISVRLIGGTLFGLAPIPVNFAFFFVDDYLTYFLLYFGIVLPNKIAEIATVVCVSIFVCTVIERSVLKFSSTSAAPLVVRNA